MEARSSYDIRDLFWIRINDCFGKTSQLFRYYSPLRSIQAFETSFNLHSRLSDRKMQLGQWNWQNHRWNTNRHRSDSIRLSFLFFFFNQRHSDAFNKTLSTINIKCFVSEIGTSDTIKKKCMSCDKRWNSFYRILLCFFFVLRENTFSPT